VIGLIPLFGRADDRHEPRPLSINQHRDQFLRIPAPLLTRALAEREQTLGHCV